MSYVTGYLGFFNPAQSITIAKDTTDSSVINTGGMLLTGLMLPGLFTGTSISFLVGDSTDGFQAKGELVFTGTTTDGDTIVINGETITFVDADPAAFEVLIGATAAETAANLQTLLDATADADLLVCTYETVDTVLTVTAKVHGTAGNAYTFTKSSTNITINPNGGTLTGGGFHALYNASNSLVSMTVGQGRTYAVDPQYFQGVLYLKIRSGSSEIAARTIICSLKGL